MIQWILIIRFLLDHKRKKEVIRIELYHVQSPCKNLEDGQYREKMVKPVDYGVYVQHRFPVLSQYVEADIPL